MKIIGQTKKKKKKEGEEEEEERKKGRKKTVFMSDAELPFTVQGDNPWCAKSCVLTTGLWKEGIGSDASHCPYNIIHSTVTPSQFLSLCHCLSTLTLSCYQATLCG